MSSNFMYFPLLFSSLQSETTVVHSLLMRFVVIAKGNYNFSLATTQNNQTDRPFYTSKEAKTL